jgi:hypothetical protein
MLFGAVWIALGVFIYELNMKREQGRTDISEIFR